ncbi:chemotaxis protein CheB [Amycolatopsis vastitatis]|uniref:protein-glutamate methylesterase n=1 Tax=Amycolatopsis vastitatis TaxID=1905142 RepID=A0A229SKH8_9PSEU|nr:chemotaxis protein CheB [Amycolatopsis vastitatis]OXM59336.1 chemotaxis protein CheB [Amycolatopsis vastitatis]
MNPGRVKPAPHHDLPVVALVASAGGLQALSSVLRNLPSDLPAAVLIVLHQAPQTPSQLAEILDRHTSLPVRQAVDGQRLTPGTVLTTPPGRHLIMVSPHAVGLIESGALPPARPSADLLLATMAATCGPRALAVVLTGHGTDGQAGTRAIARCGGTVFAQDQPSSTQFAMPDAAISTGLVHAVLPLADIATAISAHTRTRPTTAPR